jgi:hypothetical protein
MYRAFQQSGDYVQTGADAPDYSFEPKNIRQSSTSTYKVGQLHPANPTMSMQRMGTDVLTARKWAVED